MDESDFSGIGGMDETVCLSHITDVVLRNSLGPEASERACSFCDRTAEIDEPPFAILMDELGVRVWDAATWLYEEAWSFDYYHGSPWAEDEYFETNDVIYDTVEAAIEPEFAESIIERIKEATTSADHWMSREHSSAVDLSWSSFARTVRYESRFVFIGTSERAGFENEPPAQLADFLNALLTYVESDLLVPLPSGTLLYRGRMTDDVKQLHEDVKKEPSGALGSAPPSRAAASRLSPEGIGLFYAADDIETAVAEIALHSPYDDAVVGAFKTQRDLQILDFSRTMKLLPSIFAEDPMSRRNWTFARFVDHFAKKISEPVLLDGRQTIEYIPTQVVAEYLRFVPKKRIDGIAWASRIAEGRGRNVLLFVGPGSGFQSDPPTSSEVKRDGTATTPTLTLSPDDVLQHHVRRSVQIVENGWTQDDPFL